MDAFETMSENDFDPIALDSMLHNKAANETRDKKKKERKEELVEIRFIG